MKIASSLFGLFFALTGFGQGVVPPPATQAQVNAGVGTFPYVSPATLAGWTGGGGGPTNGVSWTTSSNLAVVVSGPIATNAANVVTTNYVQSQHAEYPIELWGCVGDGKTNYPCTLTGGSAVITSTAGNWSAGDVGKPILIYGGGGQFNFTNGLGLPSTNDIATNSFIMSVQSSTQITVSNAMAMSLSPRSVVWGTDNTAAFQSAVNWAASNNAALLVGTVAGKTCYCFNGNYQDPWTNLTTAHHASVIIVPPIPAPPNQMQYFGIHGVTTPQEGYASYPAPFQVGFSGPTFWVLNQPTGNTAFDGGAFFSAENYVSSPISPLYSWPELAKPQAQVKNYFNGLHLDIRDIRLATPTDPHFIGWDLRGFPNVSGGNLFTDFGHYSSGSSTGGETPTHTNACGVCFPEAEDADGNDFGTVFVTGYYNGV